MKYFYFLTAVLLTFFICSCRTMLPAEDIKIFEVCKEEIAVLKNPKISPNSKEKYEAALSLCKKVDFSYTRTIGFLGKVFLEPIGKFRKISFIPFIRRKPFFICFLFIFFKYFRNFLFKNFQRLCRLSAFKSGVVVKCTYRTGF